MAGIARHVNEMYKQLVRDDSNTVAVILIPGTADVDNSEEMRLNVEKMSERMRTMTSLLTQRLQSSASKPGGM